MAASIVQYLSQLHGWTSDVVLLERYIHQHDEAAFSALVSRHGPMVLRLCRRILGDAHAAEDAFQATFLILARKAHKLKQPDALPAWLYGVARRVALKARGKSPVRPSAPLDPALPDPQPDPLTQVSARELLDILDREVQRLPAGQRAPFVLCCLEGHTQEDAARILGCTIGSIKGRLERARQRLQTRLERRGIAISAALSLVVLTRARALARVPGLLLQTTIRAALHGTLAPAAAALAHGVLHTMFLTKLAGVLTVTLTLTLATTSTVALVYRGSKEAETTPKDKTTPAPLTARPVSAGKPPVRRDSWGDPLPPHAVARLGSLRLIHGTQDLRQVVLSPDGKLVASTHDTGDNKLWDVKTGRELLLADHLRRAFIFTANGKLLAVEQQSNRLWDLSTGKEVPAKGVDVAAARKRKDPGMRETLSPDGEIIAVVDDKRVRLLDARTRKELPPLQGQPEERVWPPCFSPDGKLLAVPYVRPLPGVRIWDLAKRKQVRWLQGKDYQIFDVAFSGDGNIVAAADGRGVTLWDARTGKWLHDPGHTYCVSALAFTPDGKTLLTGASYSDRFLRAWDPFTGISRGKWEGHKLGIRAIVVTADGKQAISTSQDGTVRLWDVSTGKEIGRIGEGKIIAWSASLSPDGKLLAMGGQGIQLWDFATRRKLCSFGAGIILTLAFSPDGTKLVSSASKDESIHLWNVANGEEIRTFKETDSGRTRVEFSSDGRTLATSSNDGTILIWDLLTGKVLRRLGRPLKPGPRSAYVLGALAFSPDGRLVAAGYSDQTVRVMEVASGKERARYQGHRDGIISVAFSPDGRLLASGSWDRTIMVWDVPGRVPADKPVQIVLDVKARQRLWTELADTDAAKAYQAMRLLLRSGHSVNVLKERLRSAAPCDPSRLKQLVAELDNDDFAVRENATRGLVDLGDRSESVLRKALPKASAEARRRIEDILVRIDPSSSSELLRGLRAVEVLEWAGTKEARGVLHTLAGGAEGAWLTHEAKAALARLAKKRR